MQLPESRFPGTCSLFRVQVETVVSQIDIFISSMSIITLDHKKKLKNNTFVGNTGLLTMRSTLPAQKAWTSSLRRSRQFFRAHCLALQMRRLKGFFRTFPRFQKSAEMARQVEISTLSAHQMARGGVVAHSSSWTRAAYELEECSSSEEASHEVLFQNFLMAGGSKEIRLCTF